MSGPLKTFPLADMLRLEVSHLNSLAVAVISQSSRFAKNSALRLGMAASTR